MAGIRWDLTALLNAAQAPGSRVERHLWLVHLLEWLRHDSGETPEGEPGAAGTPWPVRRLRHLLNVLDRHPEHQARVSALLRGTLSELDAPGLLADFGFAPRHGFFSELADRLRLNFLPGTPETGDLGELFLLIFDDERDPEWIAAIDDRTMRRLLALCAEDPARLPWQHALIDSIELLASQIRASALSSALRQRMDPAGLGDRPFHQVVEAATALRHDLADGASMAQLQQRAQYLRAVLDACLKAAASVRGHLDEYGISVDLVFQLDQLRARAERVENLLACLISPEPLPDLRHLLLELARASAERRSVRALFIQHYALLARKVTERSAETGEHYITRDRDEYRHMLGMALGGGGIIGFTTLIKFAITALALPVFWNGLGAGLNYALSFVIVQLLHWTVATKQPAMTAPSMARKLEGIASDVALGRFVDEVAHLLRSQMAGIIGNLVAVAPVVLALQGLSWWLAGKPLIGQAQADYVLHSTTLLGPTALFAAFTGVLLFASSLIAGWVENWFVFHRLDSAIAWNPRSIAWLGETRAQRWARWWRDNISGLAANVSLGLMLGLVPALASVFGLPLEVRHVTLSTGQIAAALGTLGLPLLHEPAFWWCVAAIPVTAMLNLGVSFALAFRLAMVSQGLKLQDRGRIYQALRQRWRTAPGSFFFPPRG
ncbi:site-specific recombinase [Ideonella oryzae]|uniref:Site-specific recombinase n=1 Tax=Ideonella oryzae TaxID=2937441 RepID=A0ABT1BRX1_9BURK|nr:site-specific recombinase [Ideonella oryzae]MCO5978147.1 site-specific recombinase [Ideonella oryzae]